MALRRPPLADVHADRGAKFTDFGGWEMPVEFDSIREEHVAVRDRVGKFDVSHMGEITVTGPDATALCQRLTTNDVSVLVPGTAQYGAVTNAEGVMLDDTILYRLPDGEEADLLFVPNAGHDEDLFARWETHRDEWGLDASVDNHTADYAMVAVQGPATPDFLGTMTDIDIAAMARFDVASTQVAGCDALVARTGYTGEEGFEIICSETEVATVWEALDCQPCGLGARDTLRLEAGFLLSGQDFHPEDEPRTPVEAGIGFAVDLDTEFVGREAIQREVADGPADKLTGIVLEDRGIPRQGYEITTSDGEHIGHVTSGTMSPTLDEPIALGYVSADWADPGQHIDVVVRGDPKEGRTTEPGFLS